MVSSAKKRLIGGAERNGKKSPVKRGSRGSKFVPIPKDALAIIASSKDFDAALANVCNIYPQAEGTHLFKLCGLNRGIICYGTHKRTMKDLRRILVSFYKQSHPSAPNDVIRIGRAASHRRGPSDPFEGAKG